MFLADGRFWCGMIVGALALWLFFYWRARQANT